MVKYYGDLLKSLTILLGIHSLLFFFFSWVPLRVLDILDLGTMTPKAFSSQGDAIHSKQQKEHQTLDFSS